MNARPALSTAAWGLFCASSWTWCIGMYLPLVLLRELGWGGFAVFAIPNVVGCAAFGYVLKNPDGSAALLARHAAAARWFSIIAVAYNAYFVGWMVTRLPWTWAGSGWAGPIAAVGLVAAGLLLSTLPGRLWPLLGAGVYGLSLATLGVLGLSGLSDLPSSGERSGVEILFWAPPMAFGFLLCPYLDLTFHRALRASPSRHAFGIMGVAFAAMLLVTLAYRDRIWTLVPLIHIGTQALFTTAAHLREVGRVPGGERVAVRALAIGVPLASVLLVLAAGSREGPQGGEDIYLRFLVFFGLLFPAYVLLFIGPGRPLALCRRNVLLYAAAMVVCLPFYELAFFGGRTWLLVVPLAGLLTWRAVRSRL